MIQQVPHTVPGADPAGFALALAVAYALHAPESASGPASATRAPEVATAKARPARKAAAARRRKVRG
ncbi:hypothetical protein [Streptomyces azureus]|jgi:hypothetical protein|uniref:Uncharacterized protein n=1 Tax=Streptomyces azureus TaxID=146537 RepID=A0A0K8PMG6_STRAJ|nr:hypothetical protein [Streptomyces azureus]GAP49066.1 predicted protein [Streptomyces azureus]